MKKGIMVIVILMLTIILLSGCSGKSSENKINTNYRIIPVIRGKYVTPMIIPN